MNVFSNRPYKWEKVPAKYDEYYFSTSKGGEQQVLKFKVIKRGPVTVLAETADADTLRDDGWKVVGRAERQLQKGGHTAILEKDLAPGDYAIQSVNFSPVRLLVANPPNDSE